MVDRARRDQLLALLERYVTILRPLSAIPLGSSLATARRPMARMRNRLVHHYADLAAERVHEIILIRLGDFDRFAEQITTYADRS